MSDSPDPALILSYSPGSPPELVTLAEALMAGCVARMEADLAADTDDRPFNVHMNALGYALSTVLELAGFNPPPPLDPMAAEGGLNAWRAGVVSTMVGTFLGNRFCCEDHLMAQLEQIAHGAYNAAILVRNAAQNYEAAQGFTGGPCKGTA